MGEFSRVYKTDITDRQMFSFWKAAREAGRDREMTMEWPALSDTEFAAWMRSSDTHPWVIMWRGVPGGLFVLENVRGKTAEAHFLTLPCGTIRTGTKGISLLRGMGLFALGSALWERTMTGFRLDTIVGITPQTNSTALHFAESIGGVGCGVIPGYCFCHDTHENVPGVVNIFNRGSVPDWTASL